MFEIVNAAAQFTVANVATGAAINLTKKVVRARRNNSEWKNLGGTPLNYTPLFNS